MRERLSAVVSGLSATATRWGANVRAAALPAVQTAVHKGKRLLIWVLERLETVLLSAPARERLHAGATFALIFAFAIASVDFLVAAGGFDFGATARAEPASAVHASLNATVERNRRAPRAAPVEAAQPVHASLSPELAEAHQATVLEVSQRLDAPLVEPEAAQRPPAARVPTAPLVTEVTDLQGEAPAMEPIVDRPGKPAASEVTKRT